MRQDLDAGWAGLIVEPDEWLKLGMHYREEGRPREADRCYERAESFKGYDIARYPRALCGL